MEDRWECPEDLRFLYKLCKPMNWALVTKWILIPEFSEEIRDVKATMAQEERMVEVSDVVSVMKRVYDDLRKKYSRAKLYTIISVPEMKNSINRLERVVAEQQETE